MTTDPTPDDYERTTGHEVTCTAGFTDICDCPPEPARALLERYGLPEDVIDGALTAFALELAGKIRAHRDHTRGAVQATKVMDFAADLISPENWARTEPVPAGRDALRDRIAEAMARVDAEHWGTQVPPEGHPFWVVYRTQADAVVAVLPPPADRAAVLREAADAVAADAEVHIRYGSAKDYADRHEALLRRMADEAQQSVTAVESDALHGWYAAMDDEAQQQTEPACPDPIECGHEAALGQAQQEVKRVREVCDHLRRVSVLADGEPHTDRERGVIQAVTRVLAALDVQPAVVAAVAGEEPDTETWDVPDARPGTTDHTLTRPAQHAPGVAVRCADCRAKGHTVCMDAAASQPGKEA